MKKMKKNYFLTIFSLLFCFAIQAQVSYSGNGNSGFGGTVGGSTLDVSDDGTAISFAFARGASALDNNVVIYIDSKAGGFSDTSTLTDTADGGRRGASSQTTGANSPLVTFPTGFTADYAVVFGNGFAVTFELVASGSHIAVGTSTISPTGDNLAALHTVTTNFATLGITSNDNFKFVAIYTADSAYLSNETIGNTSSIVDDGAPAGNPGNTGSITFSDNRSYPNTWTGATDNDWATATNWTNGVPSTTDNVYIPATTNQPTATGAVTINKAIIKSGSSLIAQSSFDGSVTYERTIPTDNWYLVSSPVIGQDIDIFATREGLAVGTTPATNRGLGTYNNTTPVWDYYQDGAAGTGDFASGSGRALKLATASNNNIEFTGILSVTNTVLSITNNANGFNLLGNPYPSYLAVNPNSGANNLLADNVGSLSENTIWLQQQAPTLLF